MVLGKISVKPVEHIPESNAFLWQLFIAHNCALFFCGIWQKELRIAYVYKVLGAQKSAAAYYKPNNVKCRMSESRKSGPCQACCSLLWWLLLVVEARECLQTRFYWLLGVNIPFPFPAMHPVSINIVILNVLYLCYTAVSKALRRPLNQLSIECPIVNT